MKIILAFLTVVLVAPLHAHQLNDQSIVIAKIWDSSEDYVRGLIDDTHNGEEVRCAFYNNQDEILAVSTIYLEDFATEFLVGAEGLRAKDIASYKCRKQ